MLDFQILPNTKNQPIVLITAIHIVSVESEIVSQELNLQNVFLEIKNFIASPFQKHKMAHFRETLSRHSLARVMR